MELFRKWRRFKCQMGCYMQLISFDIQQQLESGRVLLKTIHNESTRIYAEI